MTTNSRTRRGHDATGRSTGKYRDARFKASNKPPEGEPFIWMTKSLVCSYAIQAISENGLKVVFRIATEHMAHGGACNGQLPVTYKNFEAFGIRRGSIKSAIEEAAVLGLIGITRKGIRGWGPFKGQPALYRIAWLPTCTGEAATSQWEQFASLREAREAAAEVRKSAASKSVIRRRRVAKSDNLIDQPTPLVAAS